MSAGSSTLLSTQKASDSGLQAVLHPLVLLTISDYITRHALREQKGPIVGALIGQQHGREVTIEHAFECATIAVDGKVLLDADWFAQRLEQMKTIHKSPQLDLVGWYTVLPKTGPTPSVLPIHNWILSEHNESALLLAFHSEEALSHSVGSKLPLTIYESNWEAEDTKQEAGEDKEMKDGEAPLQLRFRELPYSVETGEAEMISMDFVARGAGNATVVQPRDSKKSTKTEVDGKGKQPATEASEDAATDEHILTNDEEEMIAALTAKANAIKMLQARINLLTTYLERLPESFRSGEKPMSSDHQTPGDQQTIPSYTILRSIQALSNRLSLLAASDASTGLEQEMLSEANDVHLMELLNDVMQSVTEARGIGKKHGVIESAKNRKNNMENLADRSAYMSGAGDLTI
ncbi:uncharacterized protein B0I36DRAFT_362669 [Microdochium trichocladiopsis]|uniref:COP9 signalosome complex subunit 6 n=1 Tax=Microdochium trichocladiopsis TaxID=1682393 RepID=A0A9P8Y5X3_9PEZI|nr:uncharacterized protein B0I36DRAFT_362669 [Microdochium trichocladiopsis]KAH7030864.1 hypothetical protein B0I36DRAFT_362669 [Microdochium trichocladiopsis]